MSIRSLVFSLVCVLLTNGVADHSSAQNVLPLVNAHAHNDYLHSRPLLDALSQGFCSVEADIYLVDGELLVAHDRWQLKPHRSLRRLYLDPLRERVKTNRGHVFPDGPPFTLLIDIKSDGKSTFLALNRLLSQYRDVFSHVENGKLISKPVTAIISGNRAIETILAQSTRFAGIDGRLSDLDSGLSAHQMPLISDHWGRHFKWRGDGTMDDEDAKKLADIIDRAHSKGRRVRFWAIPDQQPLWKMLSEAGVDLINTDKLAELSDFLNELPKKQ